MAVKLTATQVPVVLKQLVAKQESRCAICGYHFTPRDSAVLDHNHDSGFIRGAVHRSCNGAEGRIKTKAHLGHKGVPPYEYLIGLGKYLELHKTPKYNFLHPTHKTELEKREQRNAKARASRAKKKV